MRTIPRPAFLRPAWSRHLRPVTALAVAGASLLAASSAVAGEGLFREGAVVPIGSPGREIRLDDFNLDGRLDAAVIQGADVSVLLGDPQTVFGKPRTCPAGLGPVFVTSGDIDADGTPDLLVVDSGSGSVHVFLNDGTGAFLEDRESAAGEQPRVAALGDIDRDGKLDVVLGMNPDVIAVLVGHGTGFFAEPILTYAGDNTHAMALDDFDGDLLLDVAAAHTVSLSFFRGKGDGFLDPPVETSFGDVQADPHGIGSGDLDGDELPEIAGFAIEDDGENPRLFILWNQGQGVFAREFPVELSGATFAAPSVTDVDGDGLPDVVAALKRGKKFGVLVLLGRGDGTFDAPREAMVGSELAAIALGDIDGDAKADLVGPRSGLPEIAFYLGIDRGRFAVPSEVPLDAIPRVIASGDFAGGRAPDLATLASDGLRLIEADEAGGFKEPRAIVIDAVALQDLIAADLDGDLRPELAAADLGKGTLLVFQQDPSQGLVVAAVQEVGELPYRLAADDFDGDGAEDLVVAHQGAAGITVVLDAALPAARLVALPAASGQTAVAAGDLDGDRAADIAASMPDGVHFFFGEGRGGFPREATLGDSRGTSALRIADVDGDSAPDLLAPFRNEVAVIHGPFGAGEPGAGEEHRREAIALGSEIFALGARDVNSDGAVEIVAAVRDALLAVRPVRGGGAPDVERYPLGVLLRSFTFGDFNGDGWDDCAAADFAAGCVWIIHSAPGGSSFRRGDVNEDGTVGLTDAIVVLGRLFLGGAPIACPDAADTDDNGRVDISDPIALLAHLFLGGPAPAPPGPAACGLDSIDDDLETCRGTCP